METNGLSPEQIRKDREYRKFIWSRIILGLCIAILVIWLVAHFTGRFVPEEKPSTVAPQQTETSAEADKTVAQPESEEQAAQEMSKEEEQLPEPSAATEKDADGRQRGVYFMDKLIEPLEYELEERFWGWRPNDILNFTDNVNEMQVGKLEVTRRATIALTERISRSGSAEALNPHLERAMNWLMVKSDSFWFPAAENKYKDAIAEMKTYRSRLEKGRDNFYTRADNLIPLLKTLEELLGSCDHNLVKLEEKDGSPVSTFHADNYFYYAKGVAIAMDSILKGVEKDFERTLETRGGSDILEHAIHSCHIAAGIEPWLCVTEGSLNGILANHRANMAAHISHTRFYMNLLIETLST